MVETWDAVIELSAPLSTDAGGQELMAKLAALTDLPGNPPDPIDQDAIDRRLADLHADEPEGYHNPQDAVDGGHGER